MIRIAVGLTLVLLGGSIVAIAIADIISPRSDPPNRLGAALGGSICSLCVLAPGALLVAYGWRAWRRERAIEVASRQDEKSTLLSVDSQFYLAAKEFDYSRMRELLGEANVNAGYGVGYTALHIAAGKGDMRLAAFLFEAGADVNRATTNGVTPLDEATFYFDLRANTSPMIELLLEHGADANHTLAKADEVAAKFRGDVNMPEAPRCKMIRRNVSTIQHHLRPKPEPPPEVSPSDGGIDSLTDATVVRGAEAARDAKSAGIGDFSPQSVVKIVLRLPTASIFCVSGIVVCHQCAAHSRFRGRLGVDLGGGLTELICKGCSNRFSIGQSQKIADYWTVFFWVTALTEQVGVASGPLELSIEEIVVSQS